jgi:hypothetical protein
MKKLWILVTALFFVVIFLSLLSNNFDINVGKYKNTPQFASTPPVPPPPVPKLK